MGDIDENLILKKLLDRELYYKFSHRQFSRQPSTVLQLPNHNTVKDPAVIALLGQIQIVYQRQDCSRNGIEIFVTTLMGIWRYFERGCRYGLAHLVGMIYSEQLRWARLRLEEEDETQSWVREESGTPSIFSYLRNETEIPDVELAQITVRRPCPTDFTWGDMAYQITATDERYQEYRPQWMSLFGMEKSVSTCVESTDSPTLMGNDTERSQSLDPVAPLPEQDAVAQLLADCWYLISGGRPIL